MSTLQETLESLRSGKMIILCDDQSRENEGDLVLAAEFATPERLNFIIHEASGLVCLAMAPALADRLELPLMVSEEQNNAPHQTAFTVSIDARNGITTGISAADRAHTIRLAVQDDSGPAHFIRPGHIFPLRAHQGGLARRRGHTEGAIELMHLAGLKPAAVICEIMNLDGTMARQVELEQFAKKYHLPIFAIEQLVNQ